MSTIDIISSIGKYFSMGVQKVISFVASFGVNITLFQAQILTLLLCLVTLYIVIKIINITKPMLKYSIIGLITFLAISVGISLT